MVEVPDRAFQGRGRLVGIGSSLDVGDQVLVGISAGQEIGDPIAIPVDLEGIVGCVVLIELKRLDRVLRQRAGREGDETCQRKKAGPDKTLHR